MGLQTYESLPDKPQGTEVTTPESVGWQTIGRGAYAFSKLLEVHGQEPFKGYNRMPPYFEEIGEEQLVTNTDYTSYPLIATTHRQILCDYDGVKLGYMLEGNLFLNTLGKGFMIHFDYRQKKARYFIFYFCPHDMQTIESRLCYSKAKCKLCGMEREYDSSD